MNGVKVRCLVDTGSQVTLFSESLAKELFAVQCLQEAEVPWLTLRGANGLDIPYIGYLVTDLEIHGITVPQKGVVIVRDLCLGTHRALLGMNVGESLRGEGLEESQTQQLEELLAKWQHIFSIHDEDYGRTDVVKHQIPTGDAAPSRERYHPVPPTLYSEVRTLLQGMVEKVIIRESSSPWAAPDRPGAKEDRSLEVLCGLS